MCWWRYYCCLVLCAPRSHLVAKTRRPNAHYVLPLFLNFASVAKVCIIYPARPRADRLFGKGREAGWGNTGKGKWYKVMRGKGGWWRMRGEWRKTKLLKDEACKWSAIDVQGSEMEDDSGRGRMSRVTALSPRLGIFMRLDMKVTRRGPFWNNSTNPSSTLHYTSYTHTPTSRYIPHIIPSLPPHTPGNTHPPYLYNQHKSLDCNVMKLFVKVSLN